MKDDIMESMKDHIEEMNTSEESEMDVMESMVSENIFLLCKFYGQIQRYVH